MAYCIRKAVVICLLAVPGALACANAPAAAAKRGLSPEQFAVAALCQAPAPGRDACLGVEAIPRARLSLPGARARAPLTAGLSAPAATIAVEYREPWEVGITPAELRSAYGLSAIPAPSETQTVGIVDAYDDPHAEEDLAHFDKQFGLPECSKATRCFRKVNQKGEESPPPNPDPGWALEIATDVETVHSLCPACHILLVEAKSALPNDLAAAEETAVALGATEVSNSWGGEETPVDEEAFNHPGVVITAAAGDSGYLNWTAGHNYLDYPASSPHVVAVGGTRLEQKGGAWLGETVWNDGGEREKKPEGSASGGGCSQYFTAPAWQQSVSDWSAIGCKENKRAVVDVAADGDPYTGVDVYDSTEVSGSKGWTVLGGTSVASPIVASVFALAGGAHGVPYPARTLYESAAAGSRALHPVTVGSNGKCAKEFNKSTGVSGCTTEEEAKSCEAKGICRAGAGYNGPAGVGTPNGIGAFKPGAGAREEGAHREEGAGKPPPVAEQPSPAPAAQAPPPAPAPVVRSATVSALALTRGAIIALNGVRPRVSRLSYAFTLSGAPAQLRITLSRWRRVRRHRRWVAIMRPIVLLAAPGRVSGRLSGTRTLTRGRYELTVTPTGGRPDSLVFLVG
jgi:Subtilase family